MALRNLGIDHEVVAISEIDKFAIMSYEAIHGKTFNLGDISKVKVEDVPDCDLFTYSYPCTDLSAAGLQKGMIRGETRSGLLYECERIIEAKKPKYLLMENVKNLVSKKFKPDFDKWLEYLESLGYTNYWKVLNGKDFGVAQNRERVFVVSILGEHEPYEFPEPQPLTVRLKDVLDEEVDEKYYLKEEQTKRLIQNSNYLQDLASEPKINILAHRKNYRRNTQVFDPNGITETLDTGQGGGRGHYTIGVEMNRSEVKGEQDVAKTLLARDYKGFGNQFSNGFVIAASRGRNPENPSDRTVGLPTVQRLEINKDGVSNTSTTVQKDNYVVDLDELRIRKLTPKECFRLMGVSDEDFYKAESVNSNSQLFKQAGNAIIVPVLEGIFSKLFKSKDD